MKKKRVSLAAVTVVVCLLLTAYAAAYQWPQAILIKKTETIRMTGVAGRSAALSCDRLEQSLGLEEGGLEEITVTSLPEENNGILMVAAAPVEAYQTLGRDEIDRMYFIPSGNTLSCSFDFIPKCSRSVNASVVMTVTETQNMPPITTDASVETAAGIAVRGRLRAYEPEGEDMSVKVLRTPQKGTVSFDGLDFIYTPYTGQNGEDAILFSVEDSLGNASVQSTLTVSIGAAAERTGFADMRGNPSHYAAMMLDGAGVMSGEALGEARLFYPQRQVTRSDFLVALLSTGGWNDTLPVCVNTGLANDTEIPLWLKPYVKVALERGILVGESFASEQVPTRAEAVVWVFRAMGVRAVGSSSLACDDLSCIPEWALSAYMTLEAYGMLDLYGGSAKPEEALDRQYLADLLWQLYKHLGKEGTAE